MTALATRVEAYVGRQTAGCDICDRLVLVEPADVGGLCPLCCRGRLRLATAVVREAPPEWLVPFSSGRADLRPALERWSRRWLRTADLDAGKLVERARAVWWPMWLADATVVGTWSGEAGFDYQVKSTEEILNDGRWTTRDVMRTKVRWEPRIGQVARRYDDVAAPALREHGEIEARHGAVADWRRQRDAGGHVGVAGGHEGVADRHDGIAGDRERVGPVAFSPDLLAGAVLRLPDVQPEEAWPRAEPAFQAAVAEDCRLAVGSQHVRGVAVQASYDDVNWTWMLLPLYVSWYRDDDGVVRVVEIDGRTGKIVGPRMASRKKAIAWTIGLAVVGVAILAVALVLGLVGLLAWFLLPVAAVAGAVGFAFLAVACIPPLWVWRVNRAESR